MGMFILFTLLSANLGLATFTLYQYLHLPSPRYFGLPPPNTPFEIHSQDNAHIATKALLRWAALAATAVYTLDFVHYQDSLKTIRADYFTESGFQNLMDSMTEANYFSDISSKKLALTAVPIEAPVILQTGIINGLESWRIGVKLLVNYQTASAAEQQKKTIIMLITRVPSTDTLRGFGISQFIATESSL